MTLSWIMFALAALMGPASRALGKSGAALPFFCVLFSCAGAAAWILSFGTVTGAAAGVIAAALSMLLSGEGGGDQ